MPSPSYPPSPSPFSHTDTNNVGQKLRDGANINRSLLALANCINALGKPNANKAASYVPYRNSKLTRWETSLEYWKRVCSRVAACMVNAWLAHG